MNEVPYNANDPEFLASRSLDEGLDYGDAKRLRSFEESSPESARLVSSLRRVDSLVRQWAARPVEVDSSAFVEGVLGRIADEHEVEMPEVDQALRRWRDSTVTAVDSAFVARVTGKLNAASRGTDRRTLVYRLRRPLALAAAVSLLVTAVMWYQRVDRPVTDVLIRTSYVEIGEATSDRQRRIVVFERTSLVDARETQGPDRTSILMIGTEGYEAESMEAPPL